MGKILLSNIQPTEYRSYGVRLKGSHQNRVSGIYALGWEKRTSTSYSWDGLARKELGNIVFQYTINGTGEIRIKNQIHRLHAGDAFFVKIPSDHCYYLPSDSKEWEFIHLTLFGDEALECFERITNEVGHIIKLDTHAPPINLFSSIFEKATSNELNDAYVSSSLSYSFLMELYRYILNVGKIQQEWPIPVSNAINFIHNNYDKQITLDHIVEASGRSKYYFTRLFQQSMNTTPLQYVTKVRINKAMELLREQEFTVEQVAQNVGYSNGNYFSKVFRSYLGTSPGKYRNNKTIVPVDYLIL